MLFLQGRREGGSGAVQRLVPIWEPPPDLRGGACPRLALDREWGKELLGFAWSSPTGCVRRRLGWLRWSLEADIWAELRHCSQTRTERRGSQGAGSGNAGRERVQGSTGTGRRQEGLGRDPRADLGRGGAGGLTPPPPCPGSDGSSRRVPRAGRGRGRDRRRQRPPGRHGRRRAACSS